MRSLVRFVLLFFLFPCSLTAQNMVVVSGMVTDQHNDPLATAVIAIENSAIGTYTNDEGYYSLKVPAGARTFIVSLMGYDAVKREITVRKNTICNFTLKEGVVNLEAVSVYGKSKTQKLREGVYTMNAVDVKSLANTAASLNDIINRTSGLKIRTEGGLGADFELSLNGMSGNSVRYFIDDIPLNTKGNEVSLANFPVNTIDHIEIYKGVVPAHLGADALGGAINIITKKEKKNFLDASFSAGSFNTYVADLNAQVYFPKTGVVLKPTLGFSYSKNNYKVKDVELWDEEQKKYILTDVKRFHDDYLSALAQIEVGVENKKWTDAFYLSGSYAKVNKELQTGSIQSIVYGMAERQQDAWNLSARYRKNDFLIKGMQVSAMLSHTWDYSLTADTAYRKYNWDGTYFVTSRNEITGRGKQMRHYKRPLTIVRANLNYDFNKEHSINFNYLLTRNGNRRYDELDAEFEPSNDVLAKHVMGLSYNQSFFKERLVNTFFLKDYVNQVKIEQNDLYWITNSKDLPKNTTNNNFGYGLGTRYHFFESFEWKASYEHTVRLPLARELLGNGSTVYANLALQPESSDNFNAGAFGNLTLAPDHRLYYEANVFYRKIQNYIHAVLSQEEGTMQYDNVSSVNMKGVEGELRYTYDDFLQLTTNCSYQEARDRNRLKKDGKPSVTYNNKIPNRPWLYSNTELTLTRKSVFAKKDKVRLSYLYQYIHWFYLTWEGYGALQSKSVIPTQHMHAATLTYSWNKDRYNVTVECNNLLDSKVFDNYMLQKPGRSFLCKFRLFIH
ncbi:MAG: TonB-dependent receptor [Bacteroides sp.]